MSDDGCGALVSTEWLAEHLDDPRVRILDGSFHLPGSGRDPRAEFVERHIPGARFFDIDRIAEPTSSLPHMLPSPEQFADAAAVLGIGNDHTLIVYDAPGSAAAPRVWWTFRVFGHRDIRVLDGGLAKWLAEGRPVVAGEERPARAFYTATFNSSLVRSVGEMLDNLRSGREQVIDNRSNERYLGLAPEPRPARKRGHIPGSINIPFTDFIDMTRYGTWRSPDEIAQVFREVGIDLDKPIVASCGSGVTACTTAFAAFLLGHKHVAVYDGSWAQWGNRDDTPVAQ